ncbi:hypothetical protein N7474_000738 [Penicillium riverlandense]|uniref:uncharacterized protein n=1 Tax=Penicillium riverlandense TaxID=1903569 RepID=UPI002547D1D0|nr:uncharacterized protein N7474_000738 [Penicillium riverlandense]KAJ5832427.1 hypothetical protein N7474_000738 [Penicillium riverlandense]
MGNLCSRESDNFAQPGRVVGTTPSNQNDPAPRAPLPSKTNWKSSPGRTLGASPSGPGGAGADEARANAAIAAQKRAENASAANKGKLGSKLAAQKAQTQGQALNEASRTERAARDADESQAARRWD